MSESQPVLMSASASPPSQADFNAVLTSGAWMALPQFGIIDALGDEAARFLHGQLTNDVEHLDGTRARLAGYCSPKGRLLASFLAWRAGQAEGAIRLLVSKDIQAAVQKRLSMYVLRAKAKLVDASDTLLAVGFAGDVREALVEMFDAPLPDDVHAQVEWTCSVDAADMAGASGASGTAASSTRAGFDSSGTSSAPDASSLPGMPGARDTPSASGTPRSPDTSNSAPGTRATSCTLIRVPDAAGLTRYLLVGPKAFIEARLAARGSALTHVAPGVWDWLDIRAGEARITQPVVERFVPQMVNYDVVGGVSFRKGCYPGQEVVARSQYRGTIRRRTVLASVDVGPGVSLDMVRAGAELFHSEDPTQPCGMIVNAAAAPDGGIDLLAELKLAALETGCVHLGGLGAENSPGPVLRMLPLPYALPAGD